MSELKPSLLTTGETINELMEIASMLDELSGYTEMQAPTLFGAVLGIKKKVIVLSDKLDGED